MTIIYDKDNKVYYVSADRTCSLCKTLFNEGDMVLVKIFPIPRTTLLFCEGCMVKSKKLGEPEQKYIAVATFKMPEQGKVVDEKHEPTLNDAKYDGKSISVWDTERLEGATIDHTKIAGREEFNLMPPPERPSLEQQDRKLELELKADKELDDFFKNQTPVKADFNLLDHILPPDTWAENHKNAQTTIEDKSTQEKKIEDKTKRGEEGD